MIEEGKGTPTTCVYVQRNIPSTKAVFTFYIMYVCIHTQATALVNSGARLLPPPGCPRAIYKLMMECWSVYQSINMPIINNLDH